MSPTPWCQRLHIATNFSRLKCSWTQLDAGKTLYLLKAEYLKIKSVAFPCQSNPVIAIGFYLRYFQKWQGMFHLQCQKFKCSLFFCHLWQSKHLNRISKLCMSNVCIFVICASTELWIKSNIILKGLNRKKMILEPNFVITVFLPNCWVLKVKISFYNQ
jgi:hypothetical protein